MPYNGSGSFSPYTPGNPVVTGTVISSTAFNATQQDIAAGLSNAVTRDGQSPLTANLPAAGRKITGLGAGVVAGDSLRFEQLFSQGAEQDIASAATVDIGGLNTTIARITGTTTITSFGTNYNGPRYVRFAGALLLTHNATTLILPGGANITTAAGDRAILTPIGNPATGWQVLAYEVAALAPGAANTASTLSGTVAIANGGTGQTTAAAARTALGLDDLVVPSGAIATFARNTAPTGWLKANGALVPRTTYAALFSAIGTTFGVGDGSTTFGLPDLRGEFIRGWDDSRGADSGRVFGSFQAGEIQSHSHNINYGSASNTSNVYPSRLSNGGITTVATAAAGGAETRPRNVALLACIKF